MTDRHSESVKEKLSLSLDEIIALNNKQQKQQQQKQQKQQQQQQQQQQAAAGPQRRRRNNSAAAAAAPYAQRGPRQPYFHNGIPAVGYSVKVLGLPVGLPWPRLEGMLRRAFGHCGAIIAVVPRRDGEAWIQFADVSACRVALAEMQSAKIGGQTVTVERVGVEGLGATESRQALLLLLLWGPPGGFRGPCGAGGPPLLIAILLLLLLLLLLL
ncbi:RNA binding protein, putative [Eimeria necatrix]|uniref:RNA binding protein, putative n=1 Tax=Eimeria necatrix TaxID=51315 RepID=U6MPU7_9EIME|nr:RNA binding protein, putative [Eimeria necatrix]CDJ63685.1 RNA binding protein, putative [Eimeria necatrix]